MKKILSLSAAAIVSIAVTNACLADTVLLTEDFTYADGALVPNGTWVSHSGTPGTLGVVGGAASVTEDGGSEDAHAVFATADTGVLTAMFDINVTAPGAMTGTDFEYFAHFMTDGTFDFGARVDVQVPNDAMAGDYTLGIGAGGTSDDTLSTDFSFGETVSVLLAYDFATQIATLTAGGSTATADADSETSYDSFALRQSTSSSDETITVDNLVITSITAIPEPSSLRFAWLGWNSWSSSSSQVIASFEKLKIKKPVVVSRLAFFVE